MTKLLPAFLLFGLSLGGPFAYSQNPSQNSNTAASVAPSGEVVEVGIYCLGISTLTAPKGVKIQSDPFYLLERPFIFPLHPDWQQRLARGIAAAGEDPVDATNRLLYSCQAETGYIGNWENVSISLARGARKLGMSTPALALFDPQRIRKPELKEQMLVQGDSALYAWIARYATALIEEKYRSKFGPVCSIKMVYVPYMTLACKVQ